MNLEAVLTRYNVEFKTNVNTGKISSIRTGGDVKYLIDPKDEDELILVLDTLKSCGIPYKLIGFCTNTMFLSASSPLAVVRTVKLSQAIPSESSLRLFAGASFIKSQRRLIDFGKYISLPMCGIPGSCGGIVRQNAGAYGECCENTFICARLYSTDSKKVYSCTKKEMHFGYRESLLSSSELVLLSADFALRSDTPENIRGAISEYSRKRRESQPSQPSLGSFFKRPAGDYAARLIDALGLRGFRIGDAAVSEKHAGFIVNLGNASAQDIVALSEHIKEQVYLKYGIMLNEEAEIVGRE